MAYIWEIQYDVYSMFISLADIYFWQFEAMLYGNSRESGVRDKGKS